MRSRWLASTAFVFLPFVAAAALIRGLKESSWLDFAGKRPFDCRSGQARATLVPHNGDRQRDLLRTAGDIVGYQDRHCQRT